MLYINPSVDPRTQPTVFKPFLNTSFPTAIGYLAGYLREKIGDIPIIHDEQISTLSKRDLATKVEMVRGPKIVGLTCLTGIAKRTYELTRMIREIDPEFTIVLGGVHATALPDEVLTESEANIVVKGEGEQTLAEIYQAVRDKTGLGGIAGIAYKDKETGNIIHNSSRPLLDLQDIPPFPFDLFEENGYFYKDFGTVMSSRGCPFACIFCSQRLISGQKYRFLPNWRVINKIKLLVEKYNQTRIFFVDDVFTVNKKRCMSLLQDIIDSGYHKKVGFVVESRGKELDWELLQKMKEANVVSIAFGMETGSERMMETINKRATVKHYINAIEMTHKAGIEADASLIMGLPTETAEERKMTADIVHKIPLAGARFNVAIPYPSTQFFHTAQKEGRINKKKDWVNFSNQHYMTSSDIPYTPIGTTETELVYDTFMANMRFSLRPKIIRGILFGLSSGGTVFSVKKRWYSNPLMLFYLVRLALFIVWKSTTIILKRGLLELTPGRRKVILPASATNVVLENTHCEITQEIPAVADKGS